MQVRQAILALPERLREVLVEIYVHERSAAKVADVLGLPEEAIRARALDAVRELRRELIARGMLPGP